MKKLLSTALAIAIVFSMSVVAFASPEKVDGNSGPVKSGSTQANTSNTMQINSKNAKAIKSTFNKYYKNELSVIEVGGEKGKPVDVSVIADSAILNMGWLTFYCYDAETNTVEFLKIKQYDIVKTNGVEYLEFHVPVNTGYVIVTNELLVLK